MRGFDVSENRIDSDNDLIPDPYQSKFIFPSHFTTFQDTVIYPEGFTGLIWTGMLKIFKSIHRAKVLHRTDGVKLLKNTGVFDYFLTGMSEFFQELV